jgi:hypothetical protein
MIRNEQQYLATVARLDTLQHQLISEREQLRLVGLPEKRIEQLVGELLSDCGHLDEEIATYQLRIARTWVPA